MLFSFCKNILFDLRTSGYFDSSLKISTIGCLIAFALPSASSKSKGPSHIGIHVLAPSNYIIVTIESANGKSANGGGLGGRDLGLGIRRKTACASSEVVSGMCREGVSSCCARSWLMEESHNTAATTRQTGIGRRFMGSSSQP